MQALHLDNKFIPLLGISILIFIWLAMNPATPSAPVVSHISPTEAAVLIESNDTLILDVREKDAFAKGHLPNAISVPIDELDKRLDEFSEHKAEEVVVYCNDGSTRGPRATKQLNDAGFFKAMNLKGGVEGWKRASLLLIAL